MKRTWDNVAQANDELQKELAALKAENTDLKGNYNEAVKDVIERNATIKQLSLENERLKAENETLSDNVVYMVKTLEQLQLENERLKKFEHDASYELTQLKKYVQNLIEKDSKIQADKAELVEALKEVLSKAPWSNGESFSDAKSKARKIVSKHSPE